MLTAVWNFLSKSLKKKKLLVDYLEIPTEIANCLYLFSLKPALAFTLLGPRKLCIPALAH